IWTRRSAAGRTRTCWPAWCARSTSRWRCPAASGTTSRWPARCAPAAPGSTSAPRRWRTRTGCARSSPGTENGWRSASTCAARDWTAEGGELHETLDRLNAEGCARYVVTDVLKDGTLRGPNLGLLRDVCARTSAPVVASGGVSSLADLRAIAELVPDGVEGAIIGTALYEGAFTLEEALAEVSR